MLISRRGLLAGASASLILPHSRARAWAFGLTTLPTIGLITCGNSIPGCSGGYTFQALGNPDTGDCGVPLTQSMQAYYSRDAASVPLLWRNMAISGSHLGTQSSASFPDLIQMAPFYVNQVPGVSPFKGLQMLLYLDCASNDACVGGLATPALYATATANEAVAIKNAWLALGVSKVLLSIGTCLPRSDGTMLQANWSAFNSTLTGSGWAASNGIDYIIDLASQAIMGNWNTPGPGTTPNTYYADGVHPTVLGASLLAPIFLAGINSLIGLF